jgi:riboflavin-specific deaminase-like protein
MRMTHGLRVAHDAILVGIGTILADNPSLTARLVEGRNPQPVVIDADLRTPLGCKLLADDACVRPIVCARAPAADGDDSSAWLARRRALEAAGATVLECGARGATRIDLRDALRLLGARGIRSVMVEGGAAILTSLSQPAMRDVLGALVVTVAPIFVGGLRAIGELLPPAHDGAAGTSYAKLDVLKLALLGDDIVFLAAPRRALRSSAS